MRATFGLYKTGSVVWKYKINTSTGPSMTKAKNVYFQRHTYKLPELGRNTAKKTTSKEYHIKWTTFFQPPGDTHEVIELDLRRINTEIIMSSEYTNQEFLANNIIDGNNRSDSWGCKCCAFTRHDRDDPHWIQLDLRRQYPLDSILITGPTDGKDVVIVALVVVQLKLVFDVCLFVIYFVFYSKSNQDTFI